MRKFIITVLVSTLAFSAVAVAGAESKSELSMHLARSMTRANAAGFCSGYFGENCHSYSAGPCERKKPRKIECHARAVNTEDGECRWTSVITKRAGSRHVSMALASERVCTD